MSKCRLLEQQKRQQIEKEMDEIAERDGWNDTLWEAIAKDKAKELAENNQGSGKSTEMMIWENCFRVKQIMRSELAETESRLSKRIDNNDGIWCYLGLVIMLVILTSITTSFITVYWCNLSCKRSHQNVIQGKY